MVTAMTLVVIFVKASTATTLCVATSPTSSPETGCCAVAVGAPTLAAVAEGASALIIVAE